MIKRNYIIAFALFMLPTLAFSQSIGIGGTITQSIDLLVTPVNNSERVFNVNGNAFTAYPAVYIAINDEMSFALEAGAGFAFMSKNNSKGEVDRDLLYTFPVLARLNFGSAANTGDDCSTWGYYIGAGRQWRSAIDIHGTSTTASLYAFQTLSLSSSTR